VTANRSTVKEIKKCSNRCLIFQRSCTLASPGYRVSTHAKKTERSDTSHAAITPMVSNTVRTMTFKIKLSVHSLQVA